MYLFTISGFKLNILKNEIFQYFQNGRRTTFWGHLWVVKIVENEIHKVIIYDIIPIM